MFEFDNADISDQETADYVVECLGEFQQRNSVVLLRQRNIYNAIYTNGEFYER